MSNESQIFCVYQLGYYLSPRSDAHLLKQEGQFIRAPNRRHRSLVLRQMLLTDFPGLLFYSGHPFRILPPFLHPRKASPEKEGPYHGSLIEARNLLAYRHPLKLLALGKFRGQAFS
jgi:hypothetical protein